MALWRELVEKQLDRLYDSRRDKTMPLADAVRRFVRPGMKINPCAMQARPSAATYQLCREFAGTDPGFEVIASSIGNTGLALVHLGLVKKAVVSFAGESYPTPGPSKVIARALAKGALEIENWSMLTISQRLLAGAMGVPYLATRSLVGSSIGEELKPQHKFIEVPDPSDPGHTFGLLQAYRPDISFVHAWAADKEGNAIIHPPYGENVYGALAAREGVILTADHIVSTDFIREHAALVRVPAAIVRSVSHVPYGAHPSGNFSQGIPEFVPYGNDYDFMQDCRNAQATEASFTAWVNEWILGTKDHAEYVRKLGQARLDRLHFVAQADSWKSELEAFDESLSDGRPANPVEAMVIHASREVARRIKDKNYTTCLSGVGYATLMAWLAAHKLRDEGHEFTMMAETGIYGHDPRPADPFVFNYRTLPTTTVLTDIFETLGLHTGGASNRCLGTFGAGQIDKYGNVNSTRSADGSFIVGSGGANDIATAASESVVCAHQRKQTYVDKVDYITSPGGKIDCVVSTMGRFEKRGGTEFVLTGYFGAEGLDKEEAIAEIKARCGWDLKVADDIEELAPPTEEETMLLRIFDPNNYFLGKPADAPAQPVVAK